MNIQLLRTATFAILFLLGFSANAQCLYTLEMIDSYGDGWNNCIMTINSGGNSTSFTLDNINDDGLDSTVTFTVVEGAPLVITYVIGSFPWEVSYNIYDNAGNLFLTGTYPSAGTLYSGIGECIDCAKPKNFGIENVWDNRARLRWQPNNNGSSLPISWRVVYGLQGFSLNTGEGDTLDVNLPKVNILGLQKKTFYDAYVQQYCDVTGGYSDFVGPITFETYWTNDMGIEGVVAPVGGCDLGLDSVKIILANYGSAPQSLVKFSYAVNGQNAAVIPPTDGFYTGILGKDSSTVIAFETLTDFSAPGEYRIDVFTQLSGDEDVANDTFTYYVTNRLQPEYTQGFEVWNGGWTPGGANPSWEFGQPDKIAIPAAANGLNAWVTSLKGSYNQSELSFLESPCFDFSQLDEDASIEFSLNRSMAESFDGVWLEMTFDGGQNWERVGAPEEGFNWYTGEITFLGLEGAWSGFSDGWINARHTLPNSAGESEVHLRFALASTPFFSGGGFGIDDVHIFESEAKDLGSLSVTTLGDEVECGLENDQVIFNYVNFGAQTQSGFKVAYSVNGGTPVVQNVSGSIAANANLTQTFTVPFDSRDQAIEIKCWTILNGDQDLDNDTATYVINHQPKAVPFQEDFEGLTALPADWTFDPPFSFAVTNGHNNVSNVLAYNLYSGNTAFAADMPRMGKIQEGDSLRFTYRITNYDSQGQTPTILQSGSQIEIQVSTDCGDTYETINTISSFNHTPIVSMRERKLSLSAYAGQDIKIRFKGTWGASDFWVDLDNINILSCAEDMDLSAEVTPATPNVFDGEATVNVGIGNPPYTYNWSSGNSTQTATNLGAGTYTVTVSDAFGCSDVFSFNLGSSSTTDLDGFAKVTLAPNPTSGITVLQATFDHAMDTQIEILNPVGQRVWYISANATDQLSQTIDLSNFPSGLYLIRLSGEGRTMTQKLIKQ